MGITVSDLLCLMPLMKSGRSLLDSDGNYTEDYRHFRNFFISLRIIDYPHFIISRGKTRQNAQEPIISVMKKGVRVGCAACEVVRGGNEGGSERTGRCG